MSRDDGKWELNSGDDVAKALDWLRRRMRGKGLVLVAIGVNAVAYAKDVDVKADDAADLIEAQLPALRAGFAEIHHKQSRGFRKREQ